MTSKERQLLLEVLLLAERYSSQEITKVTRELASLFGDLGIMTLVQVAHQSKMGATNTFAPAVVTPAPPPEEVSGSKSLIDDFVRHLQTSKSSRSRRRIELVAEKLALPSSNKDTQELLGLIKTQLQAMSTDDALKFLRSYKTSNRPDENYLGLAQFLIRDRGES